MFEPERQDLSALVPHNERFERMVSNILEQSALELRRRASMVRTPSFGLFDGLLAWSRPALATAAMLTLLSLVALSRLERNAGELAAEPAYFQSAQLPAPVQVWLEEGEAPSVLDSFVLAKGEN
jgi:hypothetical protein